MILKLSHIVELFNLHASMCTLFSTFDAQSDFTLIIQMISVQKTLGIHNS